MILFMSVPSASLGQILITREQIEQRVTEIGQQLADDLTAELVAEGEDALSHPDRIVLVPIMTGGMVFAADLIRHIPIKLSLDVVTVSSYPGAATESKGAKLKGSLPKNLAGRHVVVIDDILDSGQTLALIRELVNEQNPASFRSCVMLDKSERRVADISADYAGFQIPDEFVVGYGLDYNGFYRNLPDIVALAEHHR